MRQILIFIFLCLLVFTGRSQSSSLDSLRLVFPFGDMKIEKAAISKNNKFIALALDDNTIVIKEHKSKKNILRLTGTQDRICSLFFLNQQTEYLITGSWDGMIRAYDVLSGELIWNAPNYNDLKVVTQDELDTFLFVGDKNSISALNPLNGELLWNQKLDDEVTTIHFNEYENTLFVGCLSGTIFIIDTKTGNITSRHMSPFFDDWFQNALGIMDIKSSLSRDRYYATLGHIIFERGVADTSIFSYLKCSDDPNQLLFIKDQNVLITSTWGDNIYKIDCNNFTILDSIQIDMKWGITTDILYDTLQSRIIVNTNRPISVIIDPVNFLVDTLLSLNSDCVASLYDSRSGNLIVVDRKNINYINQKFNIKTHQFNVNYPRNLFFDSNGIKHYLFSDKYGIQLNSLIDNKNNLIDSKTSKLIMASEKNILSYYKGFIQIINKVNSQVAQQSKIEISNPRKLISNSRGTRFLLANNKEIHSYEITTDSNIKFSFRINLLNGLSDLIRVSDNIFCSLSDNRVLTFYNWNNGDVSFNYEGGRWVKSVLHMVDDSITFIVDGTMLKVYDNYKFMNSFFVSSGSLIDSTTLSKKSLKIRANTELIGTVNNLSDDLIVLTAYDSTVYILNPKTMKLLKKINWTNSGGASVYGMSELTVISSPFGSETLILRNSDLSTRILRNIPNIKKVVELTKFNLLLIYSGDGYVNYYDLQNLNLLFSKYYFSNNYLVKLPNSPYYMCSKGASKMLHYVTPSLKVIGFDQLDPVYNRPDIVLDSIGKYFGGADQELVARYREAWEKRIDRLGLDKEKLGKGEISVPNAVFVGAEDIAYENTSGKLELKVEAKDPKYTLRRFNILVNEVPLYGSEGISIAARGLMEWDTTISVPWVLERTKYRSR